MPTTSIIRYLYLSSFYLFFLQYHKSPRIAWFPYFSYSCSGSFVPHPAFSFYTLRSHVYPFLALFFLLSYSIPHVLCWPSVVLMGLDRVSY
ncbi:unnamed protein product [Tuber melanosporum]|uniref:(Perigord truffle) hypothetical protein n=1 Tax=Tuber melanosporum (strain Mel28) TaxID=656061 RepID=D5GBJ4_TUBMM|nr:uncharacterized protein GSTUM_00005661001 [Tuber melanosporum]CAZ82000.1 unnamed protein product [Tuber melanosporum]